MNDMNVLRAKVVSILEEATATIAEKNEAIGKVQARIDSGAYASDYVHSELIPERDHLKFEARDMAGLAGERANNAITEWQERIRALDILNPDDIVEGDYRLLTCGLMLTVDDVLAIIDRAEAAGNRTMQQLGYRFAEAQGMTLPYGRAYRNAAQDSREAESLREPVHIYVKHWIATDKADSMLHQLFGISS